jgi:hypothetical protein
LKSKNDASGLLDFIGRLVALFAKPGVSLHLWRRSLCVATPLIDDVSH